MEEAIEDLVNHLCKKYGMFMEEAYSIIYGEWEYVEVAAEDGFDRKAVLERVGDELMKIYMVA